MNNNKMMETLSSHILVYGIYGFALILLFLLLACGSDIPTSLPVSDQDVTNARPTSQRDAGIAQVLQEQEAPATIEHQPTVVSTPLSLPTRMIPPEPSRTWVLEEGEFPLHQAVFVGDIPVINDLLDQGEYIDASIDIVFSDGGTFSVSPMELAVMKNRPQVVKLLLDRGAEFGSFGRVSWPITISVGHNPDPTMLELLLDRAVEAGVDVPDLLDEAMRDHEYSRGLLRYAAAVSNPEIIALLLDRGGNQYINAGRNGFTPLHSAAENNPDPAMVAVLLDAGANLNAQAGNGVRPLHLAARNNPEPAVVAALLDAGANPNAPTMGYTYGSHPLPPLYLAAAYNPEPAVAAVLLDRGADISPGGRLPTPLHFAVIRGANAQGDDGVFLGKAELLLDRGSDPNDDANSGAGPPLLHWAVERERWEFAEVLLEHGADMESRDRNGETALHYAARRGVAGIEGAELLLDRGAIVESRDGSRKTPLHMAILANSPEMVELLVARGADINTADKDGTTPCQLGQDRDNLVSLLSRLCPP